MYLCETDKSCYNFRITFFIFITIVICFLLWQWQSFTVDLFRLSNVIFGGSWRNIMTLKSTDMTKLLTGTRKIHCSVQLFHSSYRVASQFAKWSSLTFFLTFPLPSLTKQAKINFLAANSLDNTRKTKTVYSLNLNCKLYWDTDLYQSENWHQVKCWDIVRTGLFSKFPDFFLTLSKIFKFPDLFLTWLPCLHECVFDLGTSHEWKVKVMLNINFFGLLFRYNSAKWFYRLQLSH